MDTDLLKTFMEVVEQRHFGKAASKLYVTQSAVSARIRMLEQEVGRPLFVRQRNNISLTKYGEKLVSHARDILHAWNNACVNLSIEEETRPSFAIGGVASLWESVLLPLIEDLHKDSPQMDLVADVASHDLLIRDLHERRLDICYSYDALPMTNLVSRKTGEIELVMLSLEQDFKIDEMRTANHIMVDWGKWLLEEYTRLGNTLPSPHLRTNSARLALDFFRRNGGTILLPKRFVSSLLEEKQVFIIPDSGKYMCPVYAHFLPENENMQTIESILEASSKIVG